MSIGQLAKVIYERQVDVLELGSAKAGRKEFYSPTELSSPFEFPIFYRRYCRVLTQGSVFLASNTRTELEAI